MATLNLITVLSGLLWLPGRNELKIQLTFNIQSPVVLLLHEIFPDIIVFFGSCFSFVLIFLRMCFKIHLTVYLISSGNE